MATDRGFVKLFGKFRHWGWYTDSKAVHLFIHLLLCANYEPGNFLGKVIKRGQLATSLRTLSLATGLTEKEIRTRLKNFQKTGEILTESGKQFTLITICKYDSYNPPYKTEGKQRANKGQTKGKQRATIEEDKTIRRKEVCVYTRTLSLQELENPLLKMINEKLPELNTMQQPMTLEQAEKAMRIYQWGGIVDTLGDMVNKFDKIKDNRSTYLTLRSWMPDKHKKI